MAVSSVAKEQVARVDAIVLAGTRGARKLLIDSRLVGKPYLELGGEPLVRTVVRAALGAERIGRVFVVGEVEALGRALEPIRFYSNQRLFLVPEGEHIVDNCYRAFFQHLLPAHGLPGLAQPSLCEDPIRRYQADHPGACNTPALVIGSDLPFIQSDDIDTFLAAAPAEAALGIGLVDHRNLEKMRIDLGEQSALEKWKLGAIYLRSVSVRINNLALIRPLLGDPSMYSLFNEIYGHRYLLGLDGSVNWRNWWAMARAIVSHSWRLQQRTRFLRGILNFIPLMLTLGLARFTHRFSQALSWPFRLLAGQKDVELINSLVAGAPVRYVITQSVGPAIDIDVEDSYHTLAREEEENFRRMMRYLRQTRLPEKIELKVITGGRP